MWKHALNLPPKLYLLNLPPKLTSSLIAVAKTLTRLQVIYYKIVAIYILCLFLLFTLFPSYFQYVAGYFQFLMPLKNSREQMVRFSTSTSDNPPT